MTAAPIPPSPPPGPISPAAASTLPTEGASAVPAKAPTTAVSAAPLPFLRDIPGLPAIPGISALTPSAVPAAAVVTPMRRPWAAVYRLVVAAVAAAAVIAETLTGPPLHVLSHFAVQANILLALVLTASARRVWTARRPLPAPLTGGTVLYVAVAALVDHLLLAGTTPPFSITGTPGIHPLWQSTAGHLIHTVVPLAALLDWLLLTTPGRLHLRQAAPWLVYPLAYLAFILTRGELLAPASGDRYLYPFLDVARHGYRHVLGNALLVGLSCYALALLLITADQARPNPVRRRLKTGFRLRPPVG